MSSPLLPSPLSLPTNLPPRSYFPGHIHAFYVEYVYYKRRDEARQGIVSAPASGIYSQKVQDGGAPRAAQPAVAV
jgi:hypothetical protein